MNPIERRLRRRRLVGTRLVGVAVLLVLGSAGVVAPGIRDHRGLQQRVDAEMARVREIYAAGDALHRFEEQGLPALVAGEQELERLAPPGELPPTLRVTLRQRFVDLGADVEAIEISRREPLAAYDAEPDSDATLSTFEATPVRVSGTAPFAALVAIARQIAEDVPVGLIRDLRIQRDVGAAPDLRFDLEISYLHLVPATELESFDSEAGDWDEARFGIEDDR